MKNFAFSVILFGLIACMNLQTTSTGTPALTAYPSNTLISSSEPSLTITPTLDFDCWKKEKECEIAKKLGVEIEQIVSFSPDMQWVVTLTFNTPTFTTDKLVGGIRFIKTDGTKVWEFDTTQMSEDIGDCGYIFTTDFWSSNSHNVYFSPDPSYCSRMFNFSDVGTQVLYRLNVETGEVDEYLPFTATSIRKYGLYTFEFSPDGYNLIFFQSYDASITVKIRNLNTEVDSIYKLNPKYQEAGCPAWMDDNNHVLFYAATTTRPTDPTTSSLFMIDVKEKTIKEILSDQPNVYCASDQAFWREDLPNPEDFLYITKMDLSYYTGQSFFLNPLTGQSIAWPTPTPWPSSTLQP